MLGITGIPEKEGLVNRAFMIGYTGHTNA